MGIHVNSEVHGMISSNVKTVTAIVLIAILSFAFFGACGKQKDSTPDPVNEVKGVGIDPQTLVTAVAKRGYTAEVVK
jgi:hypothetical protein